MNACLTVKNIPIVIEMLLRSQNEYFDDDIVVNLYFSIFPHWASFGPFFGLGPQ